jgi:hypothetical protein
MNNMDIWEKVCKTDVSSTKKAKIGQHNITAICPQSQRKAATLMFGPYGIGWGLNSDSESFEFIDVGDTKLCLYRATMFYIDEHTDRGEFTICSTVKVSYVTQGKNGSPGYLRVDDEFAKKAQTDALTKGLSFLGFNSDVFEGKFDDSKYVNERIEEEALKPYLELVKKHQSSIDVIKSYLSKVAISNDKVIDTHNDLEYAAEAWYELTEDEQEALWRSPSSGGCFTTAERKIMCMSEFAAAYYKDR